MNAAGLACVFLGGFAVALAANLPMRAVVDGTKAHAANFSARAVSGTVWNGRIEDARFHGIVMGDADATLDPFSVLTGSPRLHIRAEKGELTLVTGREQGFEAANIALDLERLGLSLPVAGTVRLENASLRLAQGTCAAARGQIAIDALKPARGELRGNLSCAGPEIRVQLRGTQNGVEMIVDSRIAANGRYRIVSDIAASDPAVMSAFRLAGFAENNGRMTRTDEGALGS